MATISERAGVPVKQNHSFRATAVTRMFASGVPEKIVGEKCKIETESENRNFLMYAYNAEPSLYTQYYRTVWYDSNRCFMHLTLWLY